MSFLMLGRAFALSGVACALAFGAGCSSSVASRTHEGDTFGAGDPGMSGVSGQGNASPAGGAAGSPLVVVLQDADSDPGQAGHGVFIPGPLPSDFKATELGGYKLG